jgi:uncharacterized protein (DUF2062 family)
MLDAVLNLVKRRLVDPVKGLLRHGATPERLAWSLAVGVVVGVNPLLGSTTLIALAAAALFRLNVVASQVGNHAMYPVEIVLFPVFVKMGSLLFGTAGLPLEPKELWAAVKGHPWDTTRLLWRWEWHALVVWAGFAVVAAPAIAMGLRPALERVSRRMNRKEVTEAS